MLGFGLAWLSIPLPPTVMEEELQVEPPEILSSLLFPCTQCHARGQRPDNPVGHAGFHTDKSISGHGEPTKSCFDCHNRVNFDTLRLVGGEEVAFEQLHLLCGQCHGKIHIAWKAGAYGKRIGLWNGEKRYYSCTECHDPHRPQFSRVKPDSAPVRPEETLR